jgi:hypothetical protein
MELAIRLEIVEGFFLRHGPAAEFLYKQLLDVKKEKDRPKIAKQHNILDKDIGKDKDDLIV